MTAHRSPCGLPTDLADVKRCLVMSVLNVTPDSFSDGGDFLDMRVAVEHGLAQWRAGADLVDVGGESTRPGADRISTNVELERVLPVVSTLSSQGVAVSIDTMRAEVAREAVAAGAVLVNDVSGGLADPDMLGFLAGVSVPVVLMHWRGHSADMQSRASYPRGVVREVHDELGERLFAAVAAGVDPERIVLDPGLGFAKEPAHNWELLRQIARLAELGRPLLLGASRKRFLGELLADADGQPRGAKERDDATTAVTVMAAVAGAWCVRVHDAQSSADAVRVVDAWSEPSS